MTISAPSLAAAPAKRKPNRVTSLPVPDLLSVAFVRDAEAARYLGLSVNSVYYLVREGKLKRVWPRPRAARLTAESVVSYREAVEAGKPPKLWSQPANFHEQPTPAPEPEPKKKGLLGRWGIGGIDCWISPFIRNE